MTQNYGRYALTLVVLYAIVSILLGIDPHMRQDWLLENFLVAAFIGGLAFIKRWFVFSRVSLTLIFAYLCLHQIGAHYTYSLVPYDAWFKSVTGEPLSSIMGWERNHFDRLVHLCYGLLLAYPIRELFLRVANVRGFWGYFLPLDLTMSTSMLYELFEWGAMLVFGGELGMAYLGSQGDVWDAHKDMALASLGAIVAMGITAAINWRLHADFAQEWADSLRVKGAEPLGEVAIAKMRHAKGLGQG